MIKRILLLFISMQLYVSIHAQELYVEFEGEGFDTVHFRDMSPEAINKSFFRWNLMSVIFYGGDYKESASGPFCLDFDYHRFIGNTQHLMRAYANWQLLDIAYLEDEDEGIKRTNAGIEYAFGIHSKLGEKIQKMTFYHIIPEKEYIYYGDNKVDSIRSIIKLEAEIPVVVKKQISLTTGLHYFQRSVNDYNNVVLDTADLYYSINWNKVSMVHAGVEFQNISHSTFYSEKFGGGRNYLLSGFYMDVLYALRMRIDGSYTLHRDTGDPETNQVSFTDIENLPEAKMRNFGCRIGYYRNYSIKYLHSVGNSIRLEGGILPGSKAAAFYGAFSLGICWGSKDHLIPVVKEMRKK